jgi:hypothetical protein
MRAFVSVTGAALAASAVAVVALAAGPASTVPLAARTPVSFGVPAGALRDARPTVIHRSAPPAAKPVATRPTAARPAVKHASTAAAHVHQTAHHATPSSGPTGPTSWRALNAAIARIPTYVPGAAHWVVKDTGWWGTADWDTGVIYVSPSVPENKLYDVAVHEWSHILSVRDYGGDVVKAVTAMQLYFSGKVSTTDVMPAEMAADCMAIAQGATWTDYTSCSSSRWQAGARALVAGHQLPGISV